MRAHALLERLPRDVQALVTSRVLCERLSAIWDERQLGRCESFLLHAPSEDDLLLIELMEGHRPVPAARDLTVAIQLVADVAVCEPRERPRNARRDEIVEWIGPLLTALDLSASSEQMGLLFKWHIFSEDNQFVKSLERFASV